MLRAHQTCCAPDRRGASLAYRGRPSRRRRKRRALLPRRRSIVTERLHQRHGAARCGLQTHVPVSVSARGAAYTALNWPKATANVRSVPVRSASRPIRADESSPQSFWSAAFATSSSRGPAIPTGSITTVVPRCSRMFAGWRSPCRATIGRPSPCLSSAWPSACKEGTCVTAALMLVRQSPSPRRLELVGR